MKKYHQTGRRRFSVPTLQIQAHFPYFHQLIGYNFQDKSRYCGLLNKKKVIEPCSWQGKWYYVIIVKVVRIGQNKPGLSFQHGTNGRFGNNCYKWRDKWLYKGNEHNACRFVMPACFLSFGSKSMLLNWKHHWVAFSVVC